MNYVPKKEAKYTITYVISSTNQLKQCIERSLNYACTVQFVLIDDNAILSEELKEHVTTTTLKLLRTEIYYAGWKQTL